MLSRVTSLAACWLLALPGAAAERERNHVAASPPSSDPAAAAAAADLWDIAANHLEISLQQASDPTQRQVLALRLAEAWIRDRQADRALMLLDQPYLANHPALPFWRAQALAALGRFQQAADLFAAALNREHPPYADETALSLAQLQISLGQPEVALTTLQPLGKSSSPTTSTLARLWITRLAIDLKRLAEARQSLPPSDSCPPNFRAHVRWTEAQLLLAEQQPHAARDLFQSLLAEPRGLSVELYHSAAVGLAQAFVQANQPDDAVKFLLDFIQSHPDSPELAALFAWLELLLPAKPTLTDPILAKLLQWLPPAQVPAAGPLPLLSGGAQSAYPLALSPDDDRAACAMYLRAKGLRQTGVPAAQFEARRLLNRMRWDYPGHFLTVPSLLESARDWFASNRAPLAFALLDTIRESAPALSDQGAAAFLEAKLAYEQGDLALAAARFDEAAKLLEGERARTAAFNAAVARLRDDPGAPVLVHADIVDPALQADLQLEQALVKPDPAARRAALEEFLAQHHSHPRAAEARLGAAEAALSTPQPDRSFARAQLETLNTESFPNPPSAARLAAVSLRIADLDPDSDAAIAMAKQVMADFAGQPVAQQALLVLGRKWFENRNYNDARMALEKFAANCPQPDQAQAAWLLAARSAALVPTVQSRREALILFDQVIRANRSLAAAAKLEKARVLIDLNRLGEAESFLAEWFRTLEATSPLYLPCGLLLGESIYAQGSQRADSLRAALAVYDQLLGRVQRPSADFNRIQFLRGRALEQLADPADPTRTQEKQAFSAYYSVLETAAPPPEWHYFELSGFRALTLLEKSARWQAAVACARKIASFQGPRAQEAAQRAEQIQLQQMIWDD